jgi:hypothetical protein
MQANALLMKGNLRGELDLVALILRRINTRVEWSGVYINRKQSMCPIRTAKKGLNLVMHTGQPSHALHAHVYEIPVSAWLATSLATPVKIPILQGASYSQY